MLNYANPVRLTVLTAAVSAAALTAGCSAGAAPTSRPQAPSFTWKAVPTKAIDSTLLQSEVVGLAADSTSVALAVLEPAGAPLSDGTRIYATPQLFVSGNQGKTWHPAPVPGLVSFAQQPVAGYAGSLYLLGDTSTDSGPRLAVWRSPDGKHWSKAELLPEPTALQPTPFRGQTNGAGITVARGGAEVYVEQEDNEGNGSSLDFFHAAGRSPFKQAGTTYLSYGGDQPILSTDGSGYIFTANGDDKAHGVEEAEVYTSPDGANWANQTSALPVHTANWGTHVGVGNAGTLVVAGWSTSFADGISQLTEIWTKLDSSNVVWKGTQYLDPGRLPQPGVGPIGTQDINDVEPLGQGFLAIGQGTSDAATDTPVYYGAVWYSPNGRTWSKQPEIATGFERAATIDYATISGTHIVLIGRGAGTAGNKDGLLIWSGIFKP